MKDLLDQINGVVWGPITLWLIGLTGLYLMLGLRLMPLRQIGFAVRQTFRSIRHSGGEGDVSAFESLMTALAATIGTGNVAGVASVNDLIVVSAPAPEAQYHTVVSGDNLSKIAKKFYGDANKYPVIFEANKPMLQHPDKIYPGQMLRIPPV